ncbi:type I glutamate--ammonia ligase [Candidatus Fermentibacteria bacterium]|nr:type I glutamate--ammonia ligase [Candidatus Fermentibacteria bacterium]
MFSSLEELQQYVKSEEIQAIDLRFVDLLGAWHHITIPARAANDELMEKGVGFDSGSIPGFRTVESGDMVLIPDLSTAFVDPFPSVATVCLICTIAEADTRATVPNDPRTVALAAERYLAGSTFATSSIWGPEFEFYVFDRARYNDSGTFLLADVFSQESHAFLEGEMLAHEGYQMGAQKGYHAIPPLDSLADWRSELMELLEDAGVPVKYHHHEVGASGQCEVEVDMGPLTVMADRTMILKYFVHMLAARYGKLATFMPKPIYGEAGSGMHFHQMLRRGDEPVFYDEKGYGGFSGLGLSYIAGILDHGRSLGAITNPSTNSYKRLIPGFEAPVKLFFSLANRSAAIRIPKYATAPLDKRMEYRPPDATCNPYLAMSGMLLAGIDGMRRGLDPSAMNFGPFDQDLFHHPDEEFKRSIRSVPVSLEEAMEALMADQGYLVDGGVFPASLLATLVSIKSKEARSVADRPHPHEFALYFNA